MSDLFNLEIEVQRISEEAYQRHRENCRVDFSTIHETPDRLLSGTEADFLKYMDGKDIHEVAGYWTHDKHLAVGELISEFIGMGLLSYGIHPKGFKVDELKSLLLKKNVELKGSKIQLVQAVNEIYRTDELRNVSPRLCCALTEKGTRTVSARTSMKSDEEQAKVSKIIEDHYRGAGDSSTWEGLLWKEQFFKNQTDNDQYIALLIYKNSPSIPKKLLKEYNLISYEESTEAEMATTCKELQERYKNQEYKEFPTTYDEYSSYRADCSIAYDYVKIAGAYERIGLVHKALNFYEKAVALNDDLESTYETLLGYYDEFDCPGAYDRIEKRLETLEAFNNSDFDDE